MLSTSFVVVVTFNTYLLKRRYVPNVAVEECLGPTDNQRLALILET